METIVLTESQLCNIISVVTMAVSDAIMAISDKHPDGYNVAYDYVIKELKRNGVESDEVATHIAAILSNHYN